MEFGSAGSAVLWLLVTFPAYWTFQWMVEGEPFTLWQRQTGNVTATLGEGISQKIAEAGSSLSTAASSLATAEAA